MSRLDREGARCVAEEDYSLTRCLLQHAATSSGCLVNYTDTGEQAHRCTMDSFKLYFDLLIWIKQSKISQVQHKTGCYPKCKIVQYTFETTERSIDWAANWTSEVYVQPKSSFVEYSAEYLSFDLDALLSNVGGNLGLFLGWSLLTVTEALGFLVCIFKLRNKRN